MSVLWKQVRVCAKEYGEIKDFKSYIARQLGVKDEDLNSVKIKKKSLDARRKRKIIYLFQLEIDAKDEPSLLKHHSYLENNAGKQLSGPFDDIKRPAGPLRHRPLIIGSGPAGIFTALSLKEAGISSHVIERGEAVGKRIKTVNKLRLRGEFDSESNFCFGEGGAGTFSDGKLTCGRNHPFIRYIFDKFISYGAPKHIAYESHPHIGTDFLLKVAAKMRLDLQASGCDFSFGSKFQSFRSGGKHARYEVTLSDGSLLHTDHLILAIGHSARDTYQWLYEEGVAMAPKPFAMGARIEHPQDVINEIQFGRCDFLPAAEYKLAARAGSRGIWTFCMCPGGHLLPTQAQEGHLAINGMSYQSRNSGYANAAVVVNVLREDFYKGHPLDGMHFQAKLERQAYELGGGSYHAPAQRLNDFIASRASQGELKSTYKPGIRNERMDRIMPEFISESLRSALVSYNEKMKGYLSKDALIVGLESKTSAPVTLLRDKMLQSTSHPGLFPCGEGAGYAGGIISAALDGVKVGKAILQDLEVNSNLVQRL